MITTEQLYPLFLRHSDICTDTRKLSKDCLFFALKGENFNGNSFAKQALEQGAAYVILDEDQDFNDHRILMVDDVLKALQYLARYHRKQLTIPVLAITGSNGKTTSKELTAAVLNKKINTYFTQGNFNNHIGVPLTLLSIKPEHEFAVVEMGANHQGEIAELCDIAQPDFGMITNIGKAHLEGFGGIEGVKKGKGELYNYLKKNAGLIFIQSSHGALVELLGDYTRMISYGEKLNADFVGEIITNENYLHVKVTHPFNIIIKTQLTGSYNFDNVMAAVAIGVHFGVPKELIKEALENYIPGNQRSQIIRKNNLDIILDAYNANPSSMEAALMNLKNSFTGDKFIALGEMLELGETSLSEHGRIASLINSIHPTTAILVGKLFKESAMKYNYNYFESSIEASKWLQQNLPSKGVLLIKGSRGSKMEKLMDAF